jgi:hypothetical protein
MQSGVTGGAMVAIGLCEAIVKAFAIVLQL